MKKSILALLVIAIAFGSAPAALAQTENAALDYSALINRPAETEELTVAMLFHKLARRNPDFTAWAKQSPEYKQAPDVQKSAVLKQQLESLRSSYDLLTPQEPIAIETPVKLSDYSVSSQGFFIESFKPDTFLPVVFNDTSYAVIPQDLLDKQFIGVTDQNAVRAIEAAKKQDGGLMLLLIMIPRHADASSPADLESGKYWLMSAEITKMMIFAGKDTTPLWQSADAAIDPSRRQELLNLRK